MLVCKLKCASTFGAGQDKKKTVMNLYHTWATEPAMYARTLTSLFWWRVLVNLHGYSRCGEDPDYIVLEKDGVPYMAERMPGFRVCSQLDMTTYMFTYVDAPSAKSSVASPWE